MKIATFTLPAYSFIDTAPLAARYAVLCASIIAFVTAGRMRDVRRYSHKVLRLVRVFTRLETQNILLTRKLTMLSDTSWRERVLKELGGMRKLRLWEAAYARIRARAAAPAPPPKPQDPAWLYTPERIAESERLKARARACSHAGHNPLIMRDHSRMDFEGKFRLAPLPREERAARQIKVFTQQSITEYNWNPIPFNRPNGFGPASVWPVEFYAAMAIEAEILEGRDNTTLSSVTPAKTGTRCTMQFLKRGPRVHGDDKIDRVNNKVLLPLHQALPRKTWRAIFENPV